MLGLGMPCELASYACSLKSTLYLIFPSFYLFTNLLAHGHELVGP